MLGLDPLLDLLDCAHPPRPLAQRLDRVWVGGQHKHPVLQVLAIPPIDEVLWELVGGSFEDHQRRAVVVEFDFVESRKDRHFVRIKRAGMRLEDFLQFRAQGLVDLFLGEVRSDFGDLGGDIRGLPEKDALIDTLEEIPRLALEPAERGLDLRDLKQRIDEGFDQLAIGQATQRRFRRRQRRHQKHLGDRRRGRLAPGGVDAFGECVAAIGHVMGDRVHIGGIDLADFLNRCLIVEVEMLEANEKHIGS